MMSHSKFAEIMVGIKSSLMELDLSPKESQSLINKHYLLIKPYLYEEPVKELVRRILVQEYNDLSCISSNLMFHNHVKKRIHSIKTLLHEYDLNCNDSVYSTDDDSSFSGPRLWECNPITGLDMYGRTYSGNF